MKDQKQIIKKSISGLLTAGMLITSFDLSGFAFTEVYAEEDSEIVSPAYSYSEEFAEEGVTVSVSAAENVIPEGAEISIEPLSEKEENKVSTLASQTLEDYADETDLTEADQDSVFYRYKDLSVSVGESYSFDITFTYPDEDGQTQVFEPQGDSVSVEITVDGLEDAVADEMSEAELLHIDDSLKSAEVEDIGLEVDDDTVAFDADHFSVYSLVIAETTANTTESEVDAYTKVWTLIQHYAKPEDYLVDPLASSYTDAQKAEMKAEVDAAISGCTTDAEKTKAIFDYVADRTYYDYIYLNNKSIGTNTDPYAVWYYKNTVCAGYARLTRALCIIEGIPAMDIIGDNHEYNAVYLTDEARWIFMDTTWASQNMYKKDSDGNAVWIKDTTINEKYYDSSYTCISSLSNHEVYELNNLSDDNFYYDFNCDYTSGWWDSDYSVWQTEEDWHISAVEEKDGTDLTAVMPAKSLDNIPLTVIESGVYSRNTEITSLDLSEYSLEVMGSSSFYGCTGLKTIEIPNTVSMIGSSCFSGCTSLEEVTLPTAVTSINSYAFYNCTKLAAINLEDTGVTTIGQYAFQNDSLLTEIELPSTLVTLNNYAFYNCEGLTSVDLSNTALTEIPAYAFSDDDALSQVKFPTSLTTIGEAAFGSCDSLTNLDFRGLSLTSIGARAFAYYGSSNMDTIVLSNLTQDQILALSSDYNSETNISPWRYRNLYVGTYTYTIRYDGNGATDGTMTSTTTTGEAETKLKENAFSKDSQVFSCWNTKADGSGTEYLDGQTVTGLGTSGQTVTLYAQWTKAYYQVNFDENIASVKSGISGGTDSRTYACGKQCILPECGYSASGYHFSGWNTEADGSGTSYRPGTTLQALSANSGDSITLYAIWTPNAFTLHFDANEGSGTMSDMAGTSYESLTLPKNTLAREGYTFIGWGKYSWASGAAYADGGTVNLNVSSDNGVITLYALWTQDPVYTVTLDTCCDLVLDPNTISVVENGSYYGLPNVSIMKRTGYDFAGWYTAKTGGSLVNNSYTITQNADHTIYAHWTPYTCHLYCDNSYIGDITVDSEDLSVSVGERSGYVFTGWYCDQDYDGIKETKVETLNWQGLVNAGIDLVEMGQSNYYLYLYSGWEGTGFTISFDANGGTLDDTTSVSAAYGGRVPALPTPFRMGYHFDGWYTADGSRLSEGDIYSYQYGQTVTAHWSVNTYTIHFEANGGEGTMCDMTCNSGDTITLEKNVYTRENYEFLGWAESDSATSPDYCDQVSLNHTTLTDGETLTLYAVWKQRPSYTIHFDANNGSGSMTELTAASDETVTLPANTFTREDYYFVGWSESKTATRATYVDQATFSRVVDSDGESITLYAVWSKKPAYTITLDTCCEDFSLEINQISVIDGEKYSGLPDASEMTRAGYTFTGWYTAETGGEKVENGIALKSNADHTLFAHWTVNTYCIYLNVNGGNALKTTKYSVKYGEQIPNLPTPTKSGYHFLGWYDTDGNQVAAGSSYDRVTDLNLTASWAINIYKIKFVANGGSGSMSVKTMTYGKSASLTANSFKRGYYTFTGWNTKSNGKGKTYANKASVKNLTATNGATITLYAQWKATSYSIKYNLNGGKNSSKNPKTYTHFTKTITLAKPTRKGYTFVGWYSDKSFKHKVTSIKKGSSGTKTLYAKWKKR